jgi:hypothetical protein
MGGERGPKLGRVAGDDVDHAARHVGGVEHLVEVGRGERRGPGRHEDNAVAHGDGGRHQRDRPQKRRVVGGEEADDADGFAHGQRHAPDRDGFRRAVELVGPGGVGEEAVDGGRDLRLRAGGRRAGQVAEASGELVGAGREVLGDVIEDLRAEVPGGLRPSACVPRRLHRVADILSVADPGMAEKLAALRIDGLRIAAVGTRLLAADIHLGRAVEAGGVLRSRARGQGRRVWRV